MLCCIVSCCGVMANVHWLQGPLKFSYNLLLLVNYSMTMTGNSVHSIFSVRLIGWYIENWLRRKRVLFVVALVLHICKVWRWRLIFAQILNKQLFGRSCSGSSFIYLLLYNFYYSTFVIELNYILLLFQNISVIILIINIHCMRAQCAIIFWLLIKFKLSWLLFLTYFLSYLASSRSS